MDEISVDEEIDREEKIKLLYRTSLFNERAAQREFAGYGSYKPDIKKDSE